MIDFDFDFLRVSELSDARKYPSLLERLASGQLSLTAAAELKPHLRSENALELLDLASEKSVRQVREALAARFPQPDAVSLIRKLPESRSAARALRGVPSVPAASINAQSAAQPAARPPSPSGPAVSIALPVPARERARIEPTAHERYRVQFAAGAVLKRKLERAADLMSHRNPQRDLARVVEAALDLLLDQLSKSHGSSARAASPTTQTGRHLNRATKRAVIQRDGERCSYTSDSGRRCEARAFLEYDHRQPSAKGGNSQVENVRLLCRAHNRLAAEREYGRDKIEFEIGKRRARSVATRPLRLRDSRQARPWRPRAHGASLPHRPDHP